METINSHLPETKASLYLQPPFSPRMAQGCKGDKSYYYPYFAETSFDPNHTTNGEANLRCAHTPRAVRAGQDGDNSLQQ